MLTHTYIVYTLKIIYDGVIYLMFDYDCRCQEEVGVLKRKLDKYKSREWMASSDEVLLEEIKTYKVRTLSLPSNHDIMFFHSSPTRLS